MLRILGVVCFALVLPLLQAQSCAGDSERTIGEPCTRTSDCSPGLMCTGGQCVTSDGIDSGASDTGGGDAAIDDAGSGDAADAG